MPFSAASFFIQADSDGPGRRVGSLPLRHLTVYKGVRALSNDAVSAKIPL